MAVKNNSDKLLSVRFREVKKETELRLIDHALWIYKSYVN